MNAFFKGFRNGMKEFGEITTTLINSLLLVIVYIFGVGTTSLIAKLFHKKFMDKNLSNKNSYWSELNLNKKSTTKYYRQF